MRSRNRVLDATLAQSFLSAGFSTRWRFDL